MVRRDSIGGCRLWFSHQGSKRLIGRMRYVGIDVHKNFCQSAVVDDAGHIVKEDRFLNTDEGIQSFVSGLVGYGDVRVAMESTGSLWVKLYDAIEERGLEAVLSNPYKTRLIAEARIKTDKPDVRVLAHLLRVDLIPRRYVSSKEVRDVRSLVRHGAKLSETRTEIKNRTCARFWTGIDPRLLAVNSSLKKD